LKHIGKSFQPSPYKTLSHLRQSFVRPARSISFPIVASPECPIVKFWVSRHSLAVFLSSPQLTRRDFLARTSAGFGALAMGALMRLEASENPARKPAIDPLNPFAARRPHFTSKAKSVIFLFMVGGP